MFGYADLFCYLCVLYNFNTLKMHIVIIVIIVLSLFLLYYRPYIACGTALVALIVAYLLPESGISVNELICWGITEVIAEVLVIMQPGISFRCRAFVSTGVIAGTLVGFAIAPTLPVAIISGAVGAFLASVAFLRLAGGLHLFRALFNQLCTTALCAIVTCAVCSLALAPVIR